MILQHFFVALAISSALFRSDLSVLPLDLALYGRRYLRLYEIDGRVCILLT